MEQETFFSFGFYFSQFISSVYALFAAQQLHFSPQYVKDKVLFQEKPTQNSKIPTSSATKLT